MKAKGNLADLVEKQSAAVGEFKAPDTIAQRAGEGTLGVAEEFAFEQIGRDRRAVDADQRAIATPAVVVNGARHQFLAGAALASDEHGGVGRRHEIDLAQRLLDSGAAADDAVVIAVDADLLLQIGVFQFQFLAQPVYLFVRGAQLLVGFMTLADVAEHDHRADQHAVVANRRRCVVDPERRTVLAPEFLVVDLMHCAVAEGGVDRAFVVVIMRAVGMGMMHLGMHVVADQFFRLPAEHAFGRRIDEGGLALGIDTVDAFAGRAQDQLVLALDATESGIRADFCLISMQAHYLPLAKRRCLVVGTTKNRRLRDIVSKMWANDGLF